MQAGKWTNRFSNPDDYAATFTLRDALKRSQLDCVRATDMIGAIFRNAAAFGAATVLCDETCCDPLYRKALRVSVGSVRKVHYARAGAASSIVDLLTARGFRQYALSPGGATSIGDLRPNGRTALYLGAEGDGLPHQVMERMEAVSIPMTPGFDSLNVAAASAIALHQLFAGRTALG